MDSSHSTPSQWDDYWNQVGQDQLHALLLSSVNQAVIATDLDGRIRFWNQAAETLFGWSQAEVLGRPVIDITPTNASHDQAADIMANLQRGQSWSGEFQVRHRDGREFTAMVTNSPIQNREGCLIGIIGVSVDISPMRETQLRLRQQTQREQALTRVVEAMGQSLDLNQIFSISAAPISELLQAKVSIVQYRPEHKSWIYRFVTHGEHPSDPRLYQIIPDADNPFAEQLKRLEVVRINDTRTIDDAVNQQLAEQSPGAWLLTPISVNGRMWGSLTLCRGGQCPAWQDEDMALASRVAAQLGIAIDQAETYRDLQLAQESLARRAYQERTINDATRLMRQSFDLETIFTLTVETISPLVQADHGAIAKYLEAEGDWLHVAEYRLQSAITSCLGLRITDHHNPIATYLKRGRVVRIDDCSILQDPIHRQLAQMFPGAWLIVPLTIQHRTWGSLTLRKRQPGWPDEAVNLAIRMADHLAVLIYQAELYQAVQQELQKRQKTEQALKEQESFFRSLYEQATLGIAFCQPDGTIVQANAKYCAITGYSEAELQQLTLEHLIHPEDRWQNSGVFRPGEQGAGADFSVEQRCLRQDGRVVWVHMTAAVIRDELGQFKVLAVIIQDISDRKQLETERQQAEAQLRHNALHDALTQLPNRNLLMTHLERVLKRLQRPPHQQFAVMFLDLDRFKLVNDSLGHLVGDQLLVTIAQTLSRLVRPMDLVARLGGDEFVILLDIIEDLNDVLAVANRILATLRHPITIEQRDIYTTASIGIVMGSLAYQNATELLRDADIAMYRAKANGKNGFALFNPTLHDQVMVRLQLEHDLRRALEQQQLVLYYQPIVNLKDGSIACLEALMRWHHPDKGLVSPADFISMAEETGLIVALDCWALHTACQQLKYWQGKYPLAQNLKVSVNLSAQDLHGPNLVRDISQALSQAQLEGQSLILEMTESLLISDTQQVIQLIAQLQDLSVQMAVDDFGTGYSSLSYLHRFPFRALKIDQSFTSNMGEGPVNREIIETIVALSDRLAMVTVAEGGETVEQIRHLQQIGCEYSQGYYFCQPLPTHALEPLLQHPYPFASKLPS